jgi:hypothetical protein
MASRRKTGNRRHHKPAPRQPGLVDDDLDLGEELIRQAHEGHAEFAAGFRKFLKQLGISGKPIGAKRLRARMTQTGIDPEGTELSRGIVEMREE